MSLVISICKKYFGFILFLLLILIKYVRLNIIIVANSKSNKLDLKIN